MGPIHWLREEGRSPGSLKLGCLLKSSAQAAFNSDNVHIRRAVITGASLEVAAGRRYPIWARNHRRPRLASLVVVGIWVLALLLCSPNPYFRETKQLSDKMVCYLNFHTEPEKRKIIHRAVVIFQFISAFVIPFSCITFCYGALVLRLRRSRLPLSSKPFKVITAVIVAFFVLCLPFHVFTFLETKTEKDNDFIRMLKIGIPLTYSLVYFNSCLNPILYFFMGHDSKERVRRSLFSAFENALADDGSLPTTHKTPSLSTELESRER
ncbi:hypothetical protein lerEdw1_009762 [Lerista edwardsae]|nr:hypothetical protein lerEdw1_009762 [Lerista edwardsae]